MDHDDHVRLLRGGVRDGGTAWADLGSGEGAFTLALADLLAADGSIHTVDRDGRALWVQMQALGDRFPLTKVTPIVADFSRPLDLPPLDGVVMANSLHFERDQLAVLRLVRSYLRPGGRLVLVEYDADAGNAWVPHPLVPAGHERRVRAAQGTPGRPGRAGLGRGRAGWRPVHERPGPGGDPSGHRTDPTTRRTLGARPRTVAGAPVRVVQRPGPGHRCPGRRPMGSPERARSTAHGGRPAGRERRWSTR